MIFQFIKNSNNEIFVGLITALIYLPHDTHQRSLYEIIVINKQNKLKIFKGRMKL